MHGSRPHLHTPLGHVGSDRGAPPGLRHTQLHPCLTSVPGGPIPDLQPTQGLSRLVSGPLPLLASGPAHNAPRSSSVQARETLSLTSRKSDGAGVTSPPAE